VVLHRLCNREGDGDTSSACPEIFSLPRIGMGLDQAVQRAIKWTLLMILTGHLRMGIPPIGGRAPVS